MCYSDLAFQALETRSARLHMNPERIRLSKAELTGSARLTGLIFVIAFPPFQAFSELRDVLVRRLS